MPLAAYRLIDPLSSGEDGIRYLGESAAGVAVEVMVLRRQLSPVRREAIDQRLRLCNLLVNSQHLPVLDYDVHADEPFLVLSGSEQAEHCQGMSLTAEARSGLDGDSLLQLASAVANLLSECQRVGMTWGP